MANVSLHSSPFRLPDAGPRAVNPRRIKGRRVYLVTTVSVSGRGLSSLPQSPRPAAFFNAAADTSAWKFPKSRVSCGTEPAGGPIGGLPRGRQWACRGANKGPVGRPPMDVGGSLPSWLQFGAQRLEAFFSLFLKKKTPRV